MNAPAVIPQQAIEVLPTATTLLQVISRAASDPTVDIDKMERLMAMHERMVAKEAEAAWNEALMQCQREMRTIAADANNPQTKSKYATYGKLDKVLRPIYTSHGFSISFDEADSPKPQHIRVLAHVSRGAHTRTYQKDMPADGKGAKGGDVMTLTHAAGAAMSYGMRYLLRGIFNVAIGEEDNDGNDTTAGMPSSEVEDWTKKIKAATTKPAAKEVYTAAIKECRRYNDVPTAEKLKEELTAHAEFIDQAAAAK